MGKMELEVKVLNLDLENFAKKLKKLKAEKISEEMQILFTYDLNSIYGRFVDIKHLLNNFVSDIKQETTLAKLRHLMFDLDNLINADQKEKLITIINIQDIQKLDQEINILKIINSPKLDEFMSEFVNNDKKWIRVRQTGDITTIAVKHILKDDSSGIQQMLETELEVESIEKANNLLEALGFSYKSYQEKKRITYKLNDIILEIDLWPGLKPFMEVEGNSKEEIETILSLLGFKFEDTVSCTVDEIYESLGMDHFDKREKTFKEYESKQG